MPFLDEDDSPQGLAARAPQVDTVTLSQAPHRPLASQGDAGQSTIMAENALAFNEYMLIYSTEYM